MKTTILYKAVGVFVILFISNMVLAQKVIISGIVRSRTRPAWGGIPEIVTYFPTRITRG